MGIEHTKLFLFDLDGTIYHDGVLIGDAKNTLATLRKGGGKIVYLTNNSSCVKADYEEKLKRIGIFEEGDVVYSSLDCAVDFFRRARAGKKVYAVACEKVRAFLKAQGIALVGEADAHSADIVLLTFDQELTYEKIKTANELMAMGKEYISTHPDLVCPTRGVPIPDAGAFIAMFKASNGREPDLILGKPHSFMADYLIDELHVAREQTLMVGDRLYTDIQFGVNAGIPTLLVLSGETTLEMYEGGMVAASYVLGSVNELPAFMEKERKAHEKI